MSISEELYQVALRTRPRMQPELLIIGAQKSGTTALYQMLARHPQVRCPVRKELDFFASDEDYAQGMDHYLAHFPRKPFRHIRRITYEASPSYLYFAEQCAPRIAKALPRAICVALLRDPVKRAYSAWNMYRGFKGNPRLDHLHDPRSFQQAVDDELAGLPANANHKYLLRGKYAGQLATYLEVLHKDKLFVHSYKDLKKEPASLVNDLCTALDIEPLPADHPAFSLKAGVLPYKERLDEGLAKELYQYFAPEMIKLREVLGYDLDIMEGHG